MIRLLAALAAVLGTCTPPPPEPITFGDSNVAMVAAQLDGTVHATPGYELDDWFTEMARVPAGSTVVVALGSNDVLEGDTAGDVAHAAALLADSCVVWVTPAQSSFDALGEPYASSARGLIAEIRGQPHVVEWDTSDYQPADPVHLTADGYRAYGPVLRGAAKECE